MIWMWLLYTGLAGIKEVKDVFEEMNRHTYVKYANMTHPFSSGVVLKDMVYLMIFLDSSWRLRVILDMCGTHKLPEVLSFNRTLEDARVELYKRSGTIVSTSVINKWCMKNNKSRVVFEPNIWPPVPAAEVMDAFTHNNDVYKCYRHCGYVN